MLFLRAKTAVRVARERARPRVGNEVLGGPLCLGSFTFISGVGRPYPVLMNAIAKCVPFPCMRGICIVTDRSCSGVRACVCECRDLNTPHVRARGLKVLTPSSMASL